MDGHIGHLHCRYRYLGSRDDSVSTVARLDRRVRADLPDAYTEALDQVLGDDPGVYVLRRVRFDLLINMNDAGDETRQIHRWGSKMARAAVQAIDRDNGDNLIRFADQATYVAQFITDLLRGRAWQLWYYGAFSHLRSFNTAQALHRVLLDNRDHLPGILGALQRNRNLEQAIAILPEPVLKDLWPDDLNARDASTPDNLRPLFAAALQLIDRLGIWAGSSADEASRQALFEEYAARQATVVDWRDRVSLAAGVFAALTFLFDLGLLHVPDASRDSVSDAELARALVDLDWLDHRWLCLALRDLLIDKNLNTARPPNTTCTASAPTPRRRQLLRDLQWALEEGQLSLDREHPAAAANVLRWYAALLEHAPGWAGDRLAIDMIRRLLRTWEDLPTTEAKPDRAHRPHVPVASVSSPEPESIKPTGEGRFPSGLGAAEARLLEQLNHAYQLPANGGSYMRTDCAGLFLLMRTIHDVRLPQMCEVAAYPVAAAQDRLGLLLMSLALRWVGMSNTPDGRIDAAVSLFAGDRAIVSIDALRSAWAKTAAEDHHRFQRELLRMLAGQRLLAPDTLHLFLVPATDVRCKALVAGDATGRFWPLGRCVNTPTTARMVVAQWLQDWQEATGRHAELVADEALAAALSRSGGSERLELRVVPEPSSNAAGDLARVHQLGAEALAEAIETMQAGATGLLDTDLTTFVTATSVLRAWAHWLRQFADSSVPYLLENFVRRPGSVAMRNEDLVIHLARGPLDVVIEMAGYATPLQPLDGLVQRRLCFELGD